MELGEINAGENKYVLDWDSVSVSVFVFVSEEIVYLVCDNLCECKCGYTRSVTPRTYPEASH